MVISSARPGGARSLIARQVALDLAERLIDVDAVQDALDGGYGRTTYRGLAGYAGLALFFAAVIQARDERRYRDALHAYMRAAAMERANHGNGLFIGVAGLIAACTYALRVEPRYAGLRDRSIAALRAMNEAATIDVTPARSYSEYDIICGRAGEAIAFAVAGSSEDARRACDYLVWLLEDAERWCCLHPIKRNDGPVHDLGLAHGLAGMIAALAIAAPPETKYERTLATAAQTLQGYRSHGSWPMSIGESGRRPSRSAWCYGTPGCASALVLASRRLGDRSIQEAASGALDDLLRTPMEHWSINDDALCHGHAGNALILASLAGATGHARFYEAADALTDLVLDGYQEGSRFGYRVHDGAGAVDACGLLQGTAGIGLALLTLCGDADPSWMRCFGLIPLTRPGCDRPR